eukprot:1942766-Lingulodinium_polyedra.AAC.1
MANVTAPSHELSSARAVVLEAPPIVTLRFEHVVFHLVRRIKAVGPRGSSCGAAKRAPTI